MAVVWLPIGHKAMVWPPLAKAIAKATGQQDVVWLPIAKATGQQDVVWLPIAKATGQQDVVWLPIAKATST